MKISRSWRAVAAAAAILAGAAVPVLAAGTASAATASPGHQGLRPEFFTILITQNSPGGNGLVRAYGPVAGIASDAENSAGTGGVFTFRGFPPRSVSVLHTDVNNVTPKISYRSCTAFASARGQWQFAGGTGAYRHAAGYGQFQFSEFIVLNRLKGGACDTNMNDQPRSFTVRVYAEGWATAGQYRHHR